MSRKFNSRKATTSYWESIASHLKHQKYAASSVFESGPEFATVNNKTDGTNDRERLDTFNKCVAIGLERVFCPNLGILDNVGDTIAAQILTVLTDRVGRNRNYDDEDIRNYLEVAANKYAVLYCLKAVLKVSKMVPRIAQILPDYRMLVDIYDQFANSININFPLPEDLAHFIEEYAVPVLEDNEDIWNKGLVIFTKNIEIYDRLSGGGDVDFNFFDIGTVGALDTYLSQAPDTKEMVSLARDIASFVKCKSLGEITDVKVYPLDAKHQATIVNTVKADGVGFDLSNDPNPNGDDTSAAAIHISTCTGDNDVERMVGSSKEENINFWDSLCRNLPKNFGDDETSEIQSMVIIDHVAFYTHDGTDEERLNGAMIVDQIALESEIDEFQLALHAVDLFGGIAFTTNRSSGPDTSLQYGYQVEPLRCKSYGITSAQLNSIRTIAAQEVFNLKIAQVDEANRNDKKEEEKKDNQA